MRRLVLIVVCVCSIFTSLVIAQDEPPTDSSNVELELDVWIPAPLISDTDSDAYQQLLEQTTEFTANNNIIVNYRIKAVGTTGSIMSTLRSGSIVAPGALPDVALIRRSDLDSAQSQNLIQSMETMFSTALLNDIDLALELGQVDTINGMQLYGLPYLVDLLVTTYTQAEEGLTANLTFDDIVNYGDTFLFPAGRINGLNQTFYLQYLAAGGVPPRGGELVVNVSALQTVLEFYEVTTRRNIVMPDVLSYGSPSAYRTDFMNDMDAQNFAVVSSSEFLSMHQQDPTIQLGSIPNSSGEALPTMDGWVWVLVTSDPTQQDLSVRYLNWMMQPDFHANLSEILNWLPSQQSALGGSLPENVDPAFIEELMANAVLPLPDSEGGTVPRAIQDALITVIEGESTAEEATQDVVEQFTTN